MLFRVYQTGKKVDVKNIEKLSKNQWLWIDVNDSEKDVYPFLKKLGIKERHVKESLEEGFIRMKNLKNFSYFHLKVPYMSEKLGMTPFSILFSEKFILFAHKASAEWEKFKEELVETVKELDLYPSILINTVLSVLVKKTSEVFGKLEDEVQAIEEMAVKNKRIATSKIFLLKRNLIELNKMVWQKKDLTSHLRKDLVQHLEEDEKGKRVLDDLNNDLMYLHDLGETFRSSLTDIVRLNESLLSNVINKSVKKLTVIMMVLTGVTAIAVVPNTIATFYGIPFLSIEAEASLFRFGLWQTVIIILGIPTLISTIALYIYLKRFKL